MLFLSKAMGKRATETETLRHHSLPPSVKWNYLDCESGEMWRKWKSYSTTKTEFQTAACCQRVCSSESADSADSRAKLTPTQTFHAEGQRRRTWTTFLMPKQESYGWEYLRSNFVEVDFIQVAHFWSQRALIIRKVQKFKKRRDRTIKAVK